MKMGTNERKSDVLKYQSRKGTDNQGFTYEENMAALYNLKFSLNKDVKDVLMASNVEGFEALDDLVLRVEYYTEKPKLYLIQFKHKENENYCIRNNDLIAKKTFSLEKYKRSYDTVISKFGGERNYLTENISVDDIHVCLVTNANLQNITTVLLKPINVTRYLNSDPDEINIKMKNFNTFHIDNPTTDIELQYSTFFRYFGFYDREVNCQEAKEEIMYLLQIRFGIENYEVVEKFIKFTKSWFRQERVMTKKDVKNKLLELLTEITDETQLDKKYQIFKDITNISEYAQRVTILKEVKISLQGRPAVSLYELTKEKFHKTVPVSLLLQNIKETINVGSKSLEKPHNYINRRLYKTLLHRDVLLDTDENIFIFDELLPSNLIGDIQILTDLSTSNFFSSRFTYRNLALIISEDKFTETVKNIKQHKDLKSFSIHYVKVYDARYLKWERSWSDPENLRQFIVYEDSIDELDVLQYFKSNLNVVSASPGMGKSTILNTLAAYCDPDVLALRLDLNTHEKNLQDENSVLRYNPLKYIFEIMLSDKNREFEEKLFIHLKENNRLILFVDAFDEISPKYSDAVLSIIEKMKESGIPTWVFTRPLARSFLQKRFGIIPINMVPLENDEINNYLLQTVGHEVNEDTDDFLTNNLHNLCNAPLYLYMLSTLIKEQRVNIRNLNITDLYDNFIDMSYQKHMEKRNIEGNANSTFDLLESYKLQYLEIHKMAALIVIFGENYLLKKNVLKKKDLESIKDFNTGRKNYELIVSVDDETPTFSHRTYAEYFAAVKIYEYLLEKEFDALYELLFAENYQAVRVMFDRIAAKALPVHLAVVEQDIDKLEALCDLPGSKMCETDDFNRTVLHFAMNSLKRSNIVDSENTVPVKILILLMQCLKNNEEILKQRDSIMNFNFYEHGEQLKNISLLHMAAYQGVTVIMECLSYISDIHEDINELELGNAPIHYAAQNGHVHIIKLLKENGADIDTINDSKRSALHEAILFQNEECVEFLIKEGADVNLKGNDSLLPLHYAAKTGNLNIIKFLIDAGAVDAGDIDGKTALHYASRYGHEDSVSCLIGHGLNVNEKDKDCRTPMHWAADNGYLNIIKLLKKMGGRCDDVNVDGFTVLHYACMHGFEDCVKYLLNAEVDVNQKNYCKYTPMFYAIKNDYDNIIRLMKEKNPRIDEFDEYGFTELHYASLKGSKRSLPLLLEMGADVNKKTWDGRTPLHCAIRWNSRNSLSDKIEIINHLIMAGADINLRLKDGVTVVHLSAEEGEEVILKLLMDKGGNIYEVDSKGRTPLHYASGRGDTKCVEHLLNGNSEPEKLTLYVNQKTKYGRTPMHYASSSGRADTIKLLKLKGGKIDDSDQFGATPLHYASSRRILPCSTELHNISESDSEESSKSSESFFARYGTECIEYLLKEGLALGSLNSYVNLKTRYGRTPMHFAALSGQVDAIELLIRHGGRIDDIDAAKLTVLHFAVLSNNIDCVRYLIREGADINKKAIDGSAPIHLCGSKNILRFLKEKGGNIKQINSFGENCLHYAASDGEIECVEYLLQKGLNVNQKTFRFIMPLVDTLKTLLKEDDERYDEPLKEESFFYINEVLIKEKSAVERTPMHYAAARGHVDIMKLLAKNGGRLHDIDSEGHTPLHYAANWGSVKCLKYLLRSGANINHKTIDGRTAIRCAADNRNVKAVNFLNSEIRKLTK